MADEFKHEALDLERNQIRLLRVLQSVEALRKIECHIDIFDVNSCPKYEALSYAWGPPSPTTPILLNGKPYFIRLNLWNFLDHCARGVIMSSSYNYRTLKGWLRWFGLLENVYRPKYLWIDQLCIDQTSVAERNHQVARMAAIYSTAQRAVVWLGEAGENSVECMDWMGQGFSREKKPVPEDSKQGMNWLISRPYWSRLWIVQEFLLARQMIVVCGPRFLPFYEWSLGYFHGSRCQDPTAKRQVLMLVAYRASTHTDIRGRGVDFEHILDTFAAGQECSDPRDKIYGLLSLSRDLDQIPVNYDEDAPLVFWRSMAALKKSSPGHRATLLRLGMDMGVTGEELDGGLEYAREAYTKFQCLFKQEVSPREVFTDPPKFTYDEDWAPMMKCLAIGKICGYEAYVDNSGELERLRVRLA